MQELLRLRLLPTEANHFCENLDTFETNPVPPFSHLVTRDDVNVIEQCRAILSWANVNLYIFKITIIQPARFLNRNTEFIIIVWVVITGRW